MIPRHWQYYEKHKVPWEGWVETPKTTHKLVFPDMKIYLDGKVSGEGKDSTGYYAIEGYAGDPSRPPNHIIFQKIYDEERIIIFDGFIVDSSIRGKWRVVGTKQDGNFCLYLVSKEWNLQIEGHDMLEIFFVNASAHGMVTIGADSSGTYLMIGVFDSFKTDVQICKQYLGSKSVAFFTGKYSSFNNRMTIKGTVVYPTKEITRFLMEGVKMKDLYALTDLEQEDLEGTNELEQLESIDDSDDEDGSRRARHREQREKENSDENEPEIGKRDRSQDSQKLHKTITEHVMSAGEQGNDSFFKSTGLMNDSSNKNSGRARAISSNADRISRSPKSQRKSQEKTENEQKEKGKGDFTPVLGVRVDKGDREFSSFVASKKDALFAEKKEMNSVSFTFSKKDDHQDSQYRNTFGVHNKTKLQNIESLGREPILRKDQPEYSGGEDIEKNIKLLLTKLSNPVDESISQRESLRNTSNNFSLHDSVMASVRNKNQENAKINKRKESSINLSSRKNLEIENFTDFDLIFDMGQPSDKQHEIEIVNRLAYIAINEGKRMNSRQAIIFAKRLKSPAGISHYFDRMTQFILNLDLKSMITLVSTVPSSDIRREIIGNFSHILKALPQDDCLMFRGLFKDDILMQRELDRILKVQ